MSSGGGRLLARLKWKLGLQGGQRPAGAAAPGAGPAASAADARTEYERRIHEQIEQFRDEATLMQLPPAYFYWMGKYVLPRARTVFPGMRSLLDVYGLSFAQLRPADDGRLRILSIGSGDCQVEVAVVKHLRQLGVQNVMIDCTELSSLRLARGRELAAKEGLLDHMDFLEVDLNSWTAPTRYHGVMAHHTLHHIVELEALFDMIEGVMLPDGVFVTTDMIGRNGHMRWPEALAVLERLWPLLPDRFKFHHQLKQFHGEFVNWDCSTEGFEGIRAQDILPLLNGRFAFQKFFAYGNLPDIFVERGYGHNLLKEKKGDLELIDFLELLNTILVDSGFLKPTVMCAVMRPGPPAADLDCWGKWTPQFCVRDPDLPFRDPLDIGARGQ